MTNQRENFLCIAATWCQFHPLPPQLSWNLTQRLLPPAFALAALATLVSGLHAAPAVPEDFAIREWHMQDGLPSDQITRINQDAEGYLWVATTSGMARFDGTHFTYVPVPPERTFNPRVATSNPTHGLIVAPFFRRGLVALDKGVFRPWRQEEFGDRVVNALFSERGGALWVSYDDGAVVRYEGGQSRVFNNEDGLPRGRVRTFASDGAGQVWIASDGFVARYLEGELVPLTDDFGGSELRIGSSESGAPWLVTRDRLLRLTGDRPVELAVLPPLQGAHYVQAIEEDRDGVLWIGTRSQGLHILVDGRVAQVPTTHEDIFSLCEDRDGNMWIGTNGGGLYRVRRKTYRLFDKTAGLLDNVTHTLAEDRNGNIWFANRDGGVARIRDGVVDVLANRPGWPRMSAISIFPNPRGGMGVTSGSGVFEFSEDPQRPVRRLAGFPDGPASRITFAARNGDVWLALTGNQVGRWRDGTLRAFGAADGFDGRPVRGIAEDTKGSILLGSGDGKLFRLQGERFERIPIGDVATGPIQAIRAESDDEIWLGTVESGIVVLRGGKAHRITEAQGLPDSNVTQIIPDGHGYLWFGSKRGIFRISRKEVVEFIDGKIPRVSPLVLGHDEGLKSISSQGLYQPAALRSQDGKLWFATRRGVVAIDPKVQLDVPRPPLVKIEEVRLDDQPWSMAQPLHIDGLTRKLEIRFGVLNLSAPERVHAKYRLDGFDADWVTASAGRAASYPRLPPGDYRFRVMASNGDGAINEIGDSIEFRVDPRWWQTWWFSAVVLLSVTLGIVWAARAWSHQRLRRHLEKLEHEGAIERERTRIAQNIHDDLGASLTRISLLTQHARHENSSGAGYFDEIHGTATDITRAMDEIVWVVNPKYDDLENLAGYLGNFAQSFLSVAGIRCRLDIPAELPPITLTSQMRHHLFLCCKETLNNAVKHAKADEVTISVAVQPPHLVISIADNGRGYNADSPAGHAANGEHRGVSGTGLESIRRRMTELGGRCDIHSAAGRGSTVTFTVECRPTTV